MTKDEIIDILKEKDVRIQRDKEKRQWLVVKEINSNRNPSAYDYFYDKDVQLLPQDKAPHQSWDLIERVSEIYDKEEWFQKAVIANRRDNLHHFEKLSSKEVLYFAITKYSENAILVLSSTAKKIFCKKIITQT